MIPFEPLTPAQKAAYDPLLAQAAHRGCAFSFANLFFWGRQYVARREDRLLIFSHFHGKTMYPYPAGTGDAKAAIEALLDDSRQRGIPFRLTGLSREDKEALEAWYPGQFCFHCDRDSFDYVYAIDDLADLKGRKYQQKRNHYNRFFQTYPDAQALPLSAETLPDAMTLTDRWYARRAPEEDAAMERVALNRAFAHWQELELEGMVLYVGGLPVAMTMASRLSPDTMDVHFEKADTDYPGAYAAINRRFAQYLRDRHPELKFLNREDDMGLPGLRKAKLSYQPHHLVEKCWAHLVEEAHDGY